MSEGFPQFPEVDESGPQITVEAGSPGCIQRAINSAPDNAVIIIPAGEYNEAVHITKNVQLVGETPGRVTICTPNSENPINFESQFGVIKNLILSPGKSQCNSLINLVSGTAIVEKCYLATDLLSPIVTNGTGYLLLKECSIYSGSSSVIYATGDIRVEFRVCVISSSKSVGIMAMGRSMVRINQCDIANCGDSGLICLDDATLLVESSKIYNNAKDGIELNTSSVYNYVLSSTLTGHTNGTNIIGSGKGGVRVEQCSISGCLSGIVAYNGFTVQTSANQFTEMGETLITVTDKAILSMTGDVLSGNCICGLYGEAGSKITLNQVQFVQLANTGIAANNQCELELNECQFSQLGQTGIEIVNNCKITINGGTIADCTEGIGLQIQKNVTGTISNFAIARSGVTHLFLTECPSTELKFDSCIFSECEGNGLLTQNTKAHFENCEFSLCKSCGLESKSANTECTFNNCRFLQNESGVNITEESKLKFTACQFMNNGIAGLSVESGSKPTFTQCVFAQNGQMGAAVLQGSQATFESCSFSGNMTYALQIENNGTKVTVNASEIAEQTQVGGIIVNDGAKATISNSRLHDNQGSHIEARNKAGITVSHCEAFSSKAGIGIMVQESAHATITESTLYSETQAAIVVGNQGYADIQKCDISQCRNSAIYLLQGSDATIKYNHIHHNENCGVQILGGMPQIIENTIEDNNMYGVNISAGAEPQIEKNVFKNNDQIDVNRE